MSVNDALHIAVMPGDGIGPEVTDPTVQILEKVASLVPGLSLKFTTAPAGAGCYVETGVALPPATVKLAEEADAVLLGAMGDPNVRYSDGTEIVPQIELRQIFGLFAGIRPARLIPGVKSPIVGAEEHGIDMVLVRESTEGLFASRGKGTVENDEKATDWLEITRAVSEPLFDTSFELARSRKKSGRKGHVTCVDKANVFASFAFFRKIFDERAEMFEDVTTDRQYVDANALNLVRRPWDFDVLVTENMFGDILSDLASGLVGGLGMSPSADLSLTHGIFQPCHGTAPDIAGKGVANPTAMILSAAMMLEWLADKHEVAPAREGAKMIEDAVDAVFESGMRPPDLGGQATTAEVAGAVLEALGKS